MAKRGYFQEHWKADGLPAGGVSSGRGWTIAWANVRVKNEDISEVVRVAGQGALIEDALEAVICRLCYYQNGKFACEENAIALEHLRVVEELVSDGRERSYTNYHWDDEDGNPAGGMFYGNGVVVSWQNGPLGKVDTPERREPNGAFVEDIIHAIMRRVEQYRKVTATVKTEAIINHLCQAGEVLNSRTTRRTEAKTEGTHEGN